MTRPERRARRVFAGVAGLLFCAAFAPPNCPSVPGQVQDRREAAKLKAILASEHPRYGDVPVPAAGATLHLGKDYYFLDANEARNVLVDAWGNPPQNEENTVGLVVPAGKTFDDEWAAVVRWQPYQKGASRAEAEADLANIRNDEPENNDWLRSNGYEGAHLLGWVDPPTYDKATHTAVWARRLRFECHQDDTVNYEVRVLGRDGTLSLTMVAAMSDLASARPAAQDLAHSVSFDLPAVRKPAAPPAPAPAKAPDPADAGLGFAGFWLILVGGAVAGFGLRMLMRLRGRTSRVRVNPLSSQTSSWSHDFGAPDPSHDFGGPKIPTSGEAEKRAGD